MTLIEILCAALILAVCVVVLLGVNRSCIINHVKGRHFQQAWQLADQCLEYVTAQGVACLFSDNAAPPAWYPDDPLFTCALSCTTTSTPFLYQVIVQVTWPELQTPHAIELSTYLYDFQQKSAPSLPVRSELLISPAETK